MKRLIHGTVAGESRQLGVKAVEGLLDAHLTPAVDLPLWRLWGLMRWRCSRAMATRGGDLGAGCRRAKPPVGGVARSVAGYGVQAFLETIPDALKATVRPVCMDLWGGYASAVAAALPQAQVVVDRFHVAVHYREVVDTLRQAECRRLNAERLPERAVPTAALRPWLRREWLSLNPDQQGKVVGLFGQTLTLASAYVLRTLATAIYEHSPDRATAQARLQRWTEQVRASGLNCFDQFLNTLHRWWDRIFNYFEGGHNSGFVEGLNNKFKLLKRRCFDLDDPVELFRRLWLDIEVPRLWA